MTLYHYCTNQTLIAILSAPSIRTSDLTLSNDSMEGKWVRRVIEETCEEFGLLNDNREDFSHHVDGMCNTISALGFCLSTEGDMLSQWRGYADGGAGVSIGFNKAYLEKLCESQPQEAPLSISPVEYDLSRQKKSMKVEIEAITKSLVAAYAPYNPFSENQEADNTKRAKAARDLAAEMLKFVPHLFSMKNPAFQEEREWRIASLVLRTPDWDKDDLRVQYRGGVDRIVPYQDIPLKDLGIPPFEEIILGPRNITPDAIISGLLKKSNIKGVKIKRSTASYRI